MAGLKPPANHAADDAMTLGDAVEFLVDAWARQRKTALYAAGGVLVLTAAYILFAPKKYRSDAQLYVRIGRESVTLDPTATTGETFAINSSRENEINSVVEILSSRGNYTAVIDRMTPEVVLEQAPLENSPIRNGDKMHFVSYESPDRPSSLQQNALTALEKQISIEAVRRANMIDASCVAGSPELAQQLLSTYLDAAIGRHMHASRASGSFEFFQQQTADVGTQYETASVELAKMKSRIGVTSLEERRKTLQAQLSTIETQLATSEADLAAAAGSVRGLREILSTLSDTTVATTTGLPQDALGEAERQRNLLAIREQELLSRYTDRHPEVLAVREQIGRAEQMLQGNEGRQQAVRGVNPTYIQIETELAQNQATVTSLQERRDALMRERTKSTERLAELNENEAAISGLEGRVNVLRTTSTDYAKKLEQSRIDRALELEQLSNITITQPATYEPKAVSPKRRVAAVVGVVFAIAMAIAAALAREWMDRRNWSLNSLRASFN